MKTKHQTALEKQAASLFNSPDPPHHDAVRIYLSVVKERDDLVGKIVKNRRKS